MTVRRSVLLPTVLALVTAGALPALAVSDGNYDFGKAAHFVLYHAVPYRTFLGDAGSMAAGFVVAWCFLVSTWAANAALAIAAGVSYRVIPWQMGVVAKLMRVLPNALYDSSHDRHEPRVSDPGAVEPGVGLDVLHHRRERAVRKRQ